MGKAINSLREGPERRRSLRSQLEKCKFWRAREGEEKGRSFPLLPSV